MTPPPLPCLPPPSPPSIPVPSPVVEDFFRCLDPPAGGLACSVSAGSPGWIFLSFCVGDENAGCCGHCHAAHPHTLQAPPRSRLRPRPRPRRADDLGDENIGFHTVLTTKDTEGDENSGFHTVLTTNDTEGDENIGFHTILTTNDTEGDENIGFHTVLTTNDTEAELLPNTTISKGKRWTLNQRAVCYGCLLRMSTTSSFANPRKTAIGRWLK
ncbi:hypothetical protein BGZ63DRAFT_427698 [Mariannaea sp. PMI_226]|nr:hypothetical protein BGZ63DRAFT_427698 [Mariannaea sp. PMI_226]